MKPKSLLSIYLLANFKCCLIPTCYKYKKKKTKNNNPKLHSCIPEVAGVCCYEAVNVQADVGQSEIEDKEVTGIPHLPHGEERQDADGIEEEAEHACKTRITRSSDFKHLNPIINNKAKIYNV